MPNGAQPFSPGTTTPAASAGAGGGDWPRITSRHSPSTRNCDSLSPMGSPCAGLATAAFAERSMLMSQSSKPSSKLPPLSEKAFMRQVVELAKLRHWMVYHTFDSRKSNPGFPDLFLLRPPSKGVPSILFCELKVGRGRLSPAQRQWLDALRKCGLPIRVWRPCDWPEIERTLQ